MIEPIGSAREYSFYQLNMLLERMRRARQLEQGDTVELRFRALPSLAFPPSDVDRCDVVNVSDREFLEIYVSFMGLFGPASPLPVYYTERVIQNTDPNHPSRDFMDLFNHRSIKLLQRCWEKYRFYSQYDGAGEDQFTRWLLSLAGIDRNRIDENSVLKWHKLLPLIEKKKKNVCSANVLEKVIMRYFSLESVKIEPWIPTTVQIQADQCNAMGAMNSAMGMDLVLGDEIMDCSSKFALHLAQLSEQQFQAFLPDGERFQELTELVWLMQKTPLDFELCLHLKTQEQNQSQGVSQERALEQLQMGWCAPMGEALVLEPARISVSDYLNI